jgi:hypothetical protein
MPDDTEVLAYTREEAVEAWRRERSERAMAERTSSDGSQEFLF